MKAMILAAGYGNRLKPLTDKRPKALIEIQHIPLLELIIRKLITTGVSEIIINTHYLADQIAAFLQQKNNFGIRIELSHEPEILGTGGALKHASHFFDDGKPFFVHNVDILSTIPLPQMYQYHHHNKAIVTLALQQRLTSRYFIVDDALNICGHEDKDNQRTRLRRTPSGAAHLLAFCGIHVISPKIFDLIKDTGRFSIVDVYLKLIEQGFPVKGFAADQFYWKDIGKPAALDEIHYDLQSGNVTLNALTK